MPYHRDTTKKEKCQALFSKLDLQNKDNKLDSECQQYQLLTLAISLKIKKVQIITCILIEQKSLERRLAPSPCLARVLITDLKKKKCSQNPLRTLKLSKGAVLNTRPQKGKQHKKEKGVPNLERGFVRPKLGTPLVL